MFTGYINGLKKMLQYLRCIIHSAHTGLVYLTKTTKNGRLFLPQVTDAFCLTFKKYINSEL